MRDEHFDFRSDGINLSGTLRLPAGSPAPVAILVSGSGANDRDETVCGHKPFAAIADFGASRGYAVLRYDDRGVGQSSGDADSATFDTSVSDVRAAIAAVTCHPGIDPNRVLLIGHSEGGLKAIAAAYDAAVHAIVMLAGPAEPIDTLLHRQAEAISRELGATAAQIEHERAMNTAVFEIARRPIDQPTATAQMATVIGNHLSSWPDAPAWSAQEVADTALAMAKVVAAPAYRSLLAQNPHTLLSNVRKPILALYGSLDTQVEADANLQAFRIATTQNHRAASRVLAGKNHLFQTAITGSISEYERLPAGPAAEVLRLAFDWLDELNRHAAATQ